MIVKYLPKKGGGSVGATLDYLLGTQWQNHPEQAERAGAKVLQGDPLLTQMIANSSPHKDTYTVGVLSFEEADLSDEIKQEIMAEFERTTFAGLDDDQYNICWIEHRDKGRLELNFVIPKIELTTQKHLNPYYDKVDKPRIDTFKKYINAKHDLVDPDDPARRQTTKLKDHNLPKTKKEIKETIDELIDAKIMLGDINNRDDIIQYLSEDVGLTIARQANKSISIINPDGGQNIRLTGAYYEQHFKADTSPSQEQTARASRDYHAERLERLKAARERLNHLCDRKAAFHQDRYRRPIQPSTLDQAHPSVGQGIAVPAKQFGEEHSPSLTESVRNIRTVDKEPNQSRDDQAVTRTTNQRADASIAKQHRPDLGQSQQTNPQPDPTSHQSQIQGVSGIDRPRYEQLSQPVSGNTERSGHHSAPNTPNQPSPSTDTAQPKTTEQTQQSRELGHEVPSSGSHIPNGYDLIHPSPTDSPNDPARHLHRPQEQRPRPIATAGTYNPHHQQRDEQDQNHHASADIPSQRDHTLLHSGSQIHPREPQQSRVTGKSDLGGRHHPNARTTNSLSLSQHTQGAVNEQSIFNAIDGQIERYAARIPKPLEQQAARDRRTTSRADAQKQYNSTVATTADRGTKIKSELQKLGTENAGMERLLQQFDSETAVTSDRAKELSNTTGASQQQNKRADTAISESKAGLREAATRLQDEFGASIRERFDAFRTQFKRHLDDRIAGFQDYLRPLRERGQQIPQTINRITERFADITRRIKVIKDEFMRGDWLNANTGKPLTKEEKEQIRELTPATKLKRMMKEAEKSRDRGGPSM